MKKAKDILLQLFSNPIFNQKMKEEGDFYHNFFSQWKQIVGEKLFGHVKIQDIHQNKIYIEIDHPAYIQMFKFKERKILKLINYKYPKLKIKGFRIIMKSEKYKINNNKNTSEKETNINTNDLDNINWHSIKDDKLKTLFYKIYQNIKE